ncbi:MAG: excinuclease ABC subunit UvrB [Eubacteriales bacterium]|nr:excinuclease ABC subunit UvrB [Eubacteriales bacterium]MDD4106279.1 excinuclease ABC subunit UvrB [Eubacteriales bacterium]MDD4711654.1 excinuclease ABC subunit UvrB [Eubacteriales bacterium]NLO15590.1 excinuclease ABC subunit UvrB [Clostridiales bacterium]
MSRFILKAPYTPQGDQPQAIDALTRGLQEGQRHQTLLGVTGSGKTYTMASVIQKVQRPTLVIAHNKTLAAQLCSEFRAFFPDSAVEYFVSYYDYYQPEAYIASSDTFIEKDSSINEEIDRLRHSATAALRERRDVIIVSSVSCIYSMGDPSEYEGQMISLRPGMRLSREQLAKKLVAVQYERNDIAMARGMFRIRGDVMDVIPVGSKDNGVRVAFFGDEIERISEFNVTTGQTIRSVNHIAVFPASHYVSQVEGKEDSILQIERDMELRAAEFEKEGLLLEAQRITQRTRYDIEMLREIGFTTGIENYSRYFDGRQPGDSPYTLLDYFPKDFLCIIDESHVTVPQIRAMHAGDRARKEELVRYGFRLPSAFDNRPLRFEEFEKKINQTIYVSATPGPYEKEHATQTVEQIIRPTGLLDPRIFVRPATGQVDDLLSEINKETDLGHRVLVTTLTKKMAEMLTDYLRDSGVRVRYLHSDIKTLERMALIRDLRLGAYDVLVGINLLREGLDLPEVTLVAILDADKEGFLRSETSLVQTVGRAARNIDGRVIMYADRPTDSMMRAINETNRRRALQEAYNEKHGITPETIISAVRNLIAITRDTEELEREGMSPEDRAALVAQLEDKMLSAAGELDFEKAAKYRDELFTLKGDKPLEKQQPQPVRRRRGTRHH